MEMSETTTSNDRTAFATASAVVPVMVAGGCVGPFGRKSTQSLGMIARPVVRDAIASSGYDFDDIQAVFVGNAFGGALTGQESILGQVLMRDLPLNGVPVHTVKNACSSGSDAVHLAWSAIAHGQYDCVLVLGAEKLIHEDRRLPFTTLATATDHKPGSEGRSVFIDVNAKRAQDYMETFGATPRHFALCASKNRFHASLNEKAAVREPMSWEVILADQVVLEPLTRAMCGGLVDGAAAVVLVSDRLYRRRGYGGVRISASAVTSAVPNPDAVGSATARAAKLAFEQAGINPKDVSLAEVHDPTAPQEFFDIEELGLCGRGEAIDLVEQGETTLGGRLPVNVSGGLTARGHPVGATGVAQIVEISEQLLMQAGKRQVDRARIGLAQMAGGLLGPDSAVSTVHLLEKI
jgi:acetyl-CoA acyltransferase